GHWLMDAEEADRLKATELHTFAVAARKIVKPSHQERTPLEVTPAEAHQVLGHAGERAIEHLKDAVDGIKLIEGPPAPGWKNCEACIGAKLSKMVSRRPQRKPAKKPFEQISIDLIQLRKTGKACYNGDKWLFHCVDQYSKWHEA
ncbi:hypothetical protein EJ04DRAFT_453274, partial [Polyplosphaeria fusca]